MENYRMLDSQFIRIERSAGGVNASNRAIIKAVHTRLNGAAKTRDNRPGRHSIIRAALTLHNRQVSHLELFGRLESLDIVPQTIDAPETRSRADIILDLECWVRIRNSAVERGRVIRAGVITSETILETILNRGRIRELTEKVDKLTAELTMTRSK